MALPLNVQGLKDDMAKYRVNYDVWFSETTLHESGAIREMLDKLAERGATYEKTAPSGTVPCSTPRNTAATR